MNNPFENAPPSAATTTFADPFAADTAPRSEALVFSGRGGEYFGIWIVNLLLTVLTLGIYSAWAKVRRLQYFHRHTTLGGAAFDYHGDPRAILKGRVIGFLLLLGYNISFEVSPLLGFLVLGLLAAAMPVLLMRSLRFRALNTSWRGLRFGFDGDQRGAYKAFLMWPLLSVFTLYLLAPMWHQRMKRYQLDNARFGATRFEFTASVSAFYRMYGVLLLLLVAGVAAIGGTVALVLGAAGDRREAMALLPLIMLAGWVGLFLLISPYLTARLQNLVWNNTRLGAHRFESHARARTLYAITLTNLIAIVCTLGFFAPFAAIRTARYRIESVTLVSAGPLDDFVAGQKQAVSATGEETADIFDVDIAL
ncbi:YjgN family protein [Methyloversatilis universalis]|uniref:YjgN family protein n=1 Tax=Methyloversatilis universalis TaxID=378211 RepID=UPI0003726287|nr:YjgN family protein [Methyloversatilis universalis]